MARRNICRCQENQASLLEEWTAVGILGAHRMTTTFPDLRSYLERLRREDDLVTVEVPVDAHLEAAEIHRRVIAAGGPAILFTNISD
ncbi:MAG: hypothetical protein WBC09_02025, partial [Thermoanaerobaculia bacterium]